MLKIEIKRVEPKSFTLADVQPGERFMYDCNQKWYRRFKAETHCTQSVFANGWHAYSETDQLVALFSPSTDYVTIEGREPAKPAEVPISQLKPKDVFECSNGIFIKTKRAPSDIHGYEYALMVVKSEKHDGSLLFAQQYSFSHNTLVRHIADATLTIMI